MLLTVVALIPVAIWSYLLLFHGGFWRIKGKLAPPHSTFDKHVVAIIPARNEAETITDTVNSLLCQGIHVIVVDDNSTDGTAEQLTGSDRLTVIAGRPLAPGWTGKLWALSQGIEHAQLLAPDYFLFTDADIRHHSTSVAELVGIAESQNRDLVSYMVKLSCSNFPEKLLMPAFVFFFFLLYPPGKTAGAAGGCALIRPPALERIGGIAAVRSEVIDDCALAAAVARSGGSLWLGLTPNTVSTRPYQSFGEIGAMIARSAFKQLKHSWIILLGTIFGLFVVYLLPIFLLPERPLWGLAALLLMFVAYLPMVRFYNRSFLWAFTLPFAAVFYMGATVVSAIQYQRGKGGQWKGRIQDF